jgi:arylsulfatase A-like enzyme
MRALALALISVVLPSLMSSAHAAARPNVLVILCDDTGWGEFGFQGATDIPTPHIDSIAADGVRFTQGYVAATYCSPCRAGLLTGRYPTRFGHEFNSVANRSGLPLTEVTIADRFRSLGYATCAIGKWHLGNGLEYRPTERGFDEFYGTVANTPFFNPPNFVDSRVGPEVQPVKDDSFYTTDAYAARAVEWLKEHEDQAWFLYLPFNAQHAPLQATQKYLDRFPRVADEKRRQFSAMMSAMDDAVGAVLAQIHESGQDENTLIFFLSDNGGPTQSTTSRNGPLHGFKSTTWEGGTRVPFCARWTGHLPAGAVYESPIIQLDILPTCLAAAGEEIDPEWNLDGVNLLPYLTGENDAIPHETLYWRFGDQWAVRHGDLKLVVARGGSGSPELYDLAADIGETKNLAAERPDAVEKLQSLYSAWNAEQAEPLAPKEVNRPANQQNRNRNRNRNQQQRTEQPATN